jgi:histone acetyltransferase MYST1
MTLYICEYCLKYMRKLKTLQAHQQKCTSHRPPGEEIYHAEYPIWTKAKTEEENGRSRERQPIVKSMTTLSMYEVDGVKNKVYCQVSFNV